VPKSRNGEPTFQRFGAQPSPQRRGGGALSLVWWHRNRAVSLCLCHIPRPISHLAVACLMRVHVARGGAHHVFVVHGL
jgi:hypothetical protein